MERLVGARLVTSDDEMLAISHEALARAWPRLRGWLDDDVDGQRILHHLAATADGWDALGRPDTELYRGVRLARALAWQDQRSRLTESGRDRLPRRPRARREEVAERSAAEQARRQAVLIRRLRLVLAGAVVLLVLALVAGGFAAVQSDRAARQRGRGPSKPARLRGCPPGRNPRPAHRRHQPLAAARGRGRATGRLAGDPGEPAHRVGQASHAWSGRRRPEAATWRA